LLAASALLAVKQRQLSNPLQRVIHRRRGRYPGRARRLWVTRDEGLINFYKLLHGVQTRSGAPREVVRLKNSALKVVWFRRFICPEGSGWVAAVDGSFGSPCGKATTTVEPTTESYS
jgi:hypothetical protein